MQIRLYCKTSMKSGAQANANVLLYTLFFFFIKETIKNIRENFIHVKIAVLIINLYGTSVLET